MLKIDESGFYSLALVSHEEHLKLQRRYIYVTQVFYRKFKYEKGRFRILIDMPFHDQNVGTRLLSGKFSVCHILQPINETCSNEKAYSFEAEESVGILRCKTFFSASLLLTETSVSLESESKLHRTYSIKDLFKSSWNVISENISRIQSKVAGLLKLSHVSIGRMCGRKFAIP